MKNVSDAPVKVIALKPGEKTTYPRGRLGGPDWSYPGVAARYVDHVYGEKEVGGTQMLMLAGVPLAVFGYGQGMVLAPLFSVVLTQVRHAHAGSGAGEVSQFCMSGGKW